MKNYIFIVEGKDKRQEYLIKFLRDLSCVVVDFGQEKYFSSLKKVYLFSLSTAVDYDTLEKLQDNSFVFTRNLDSGLLKLAKSKNLYCFDYMQDEEFVFKNAYLTAECALYYILDNTAASLKDLNVLICGGGRIGKCLLSILRQFDAQIMVASNSDEEIAYAACFASSAFKFDCMAKNIGRADVIINTVPKIILKGDLLRLAQKHCFLLDLASKPGGFDFALAKELELNFMHALGVPGKVAPKTAAKYLKDSILKCLNVYNNE